MVVFLLKKKKMKTILVTLILFVSAQAYTQLKVDLEMIEVGFEPAACQGNNPKRVLTFVQKGIEIIPQGTSLEFRYVINNDTFKQTLITLFDISPNVSIIDIDNVEIPTILSFKDNVEVELIFAEDENLGNNKAETTYYSSSTMIENDIETYDSWPMDRGEFVLIDDDGKPSFSVESVNNDKWLSFETSNSTYSGYTGEDIDVLYNTNFSNRIGQEICFETSDMEDPVLRFDYIPYYSESIQELPSGRSNLFKFFLELNGNITTSSVFHSYSEGEIHNIEFDLPKDNGNLTLRNVLLEDGDYSLFNNFRIEERFTSSVDEFDSDRFVVYPNPSWGEVVFKTENLNKYRLEVYNSAGVLTHSKEISDSDYRIPSIGVSGIYFYTIFVENKVIDRGKLVINSH